MSAEQLLSPFTTFDPLTGRPNHHCYEQAQQILHRARTMLAGRNRDQIGYILDTINYMLAYRDPLSAELSGLDAEEGDALSLEALGELFNQDAPGTLLPSPQPGSPGHISQQHPDNWYLSPAEALETRQALFSIEGQEEVPNARWSEYFATLALGLVGEAQCFPSWHKTAAPSDEATQAFRERSYVAELLIEAMAALGKADVWALREAQETETTDAATEKIRLAGKRGAVKANAKRNRTRRDFIRFVEESVTPALPPGEKLNRTAAATEYYQEFLEDEAPSDFEGHTRHRENWIRSLLDAYRHYHKTGELPEIPEAAEQSR